MERSAKFVNDAKDEIVLPKECLVKDIFGQLRKISGGSLEQKITDEGMAGRENLSECRKCRPVLERTLSHETTLKRKKREHVRMSLNDELLHSEWAIYSPEERRILDFVVRKASLEDNNKSNKERKTSKLRQIRLHRPKIFSRNRNSKNSKHPNTQESSEHLNGKRITNECSDGKSPSRKPSFIRRFIGSASHQSPSASPKLATRRESNELEKRQNVPIRDATSSPGQYRRRPAGNFHVHTLLQEELKRSSSLQCLSLGSFPVADGVEKARAEASSGSEKLRRRASEAQPNRECKDKVGLFRAHNTRKHIDYNDTFFEIFENFCKDPMALIDAVEIDC